MRESENRRELLKDWLGDVMDSSELKELVGKRITKIEQVERGLIIHFKDKGIYMIAFNTLGAPASASLETLRESEIQTRLI